MRAHLLLLHEYRLSTKYRLILRSLAHRQQQNRTVDIRRWQPHIYAWFVFTFRVFELKRVHVIAWKLKREFFRYFALDCQFYQQQQKRPTVHKSVQCDCVSQRAHLSIFHVERGCLNNRCNWIVCYISRYCCDSQAHNENSKSKTTPDRCWIITKTIVRATQHCVCVFCWSSYLINTLTFNGRIAGRYVRQWDTDIPHNAVASQCAIKVHWRHGVLLRCPSHPSENAHCLNVCVTHATDGLMCFVRNPTKKLKASS